MDLEPALWRDETLRWRTVVISACMARGNVTLRTLKTIADTFHVRIRDLIGSA